MKPQRKVKPVISEKETDEILLRGLRNILNHLQQREILNHQPEPEQLNPRRIFIIDFRYLAN